MNSRILQERYPDVYREFFSANATVLSGCFSFSWGPRSLGHASNKLILKSCLPLRCSIGFQERTDDEIHFVRARVYSGGEAGFVSVPVEDIFPTVSQILPLIRSYLDSQGKKRGYSIEILAEVGKGHALGFSGTFSAVLASALHLLTGVIREETLHSSGFYATPQADAVFRLAWNIELVLRNGRTFGQTIMHTLHGGSAPALYYADTHSEVISPEESASIPVVFLPVSDFLDDASVSLELPFDYGIVFSGIASDTFRLERFREADVRETNALAEFMSERVFSRIPFQDVRLKKVFDKVAPYQLVTDVIAILNAMTMEYFQKMFQAGFNASLVSDFSAHVNHLREVLSIIEPQNAFAEDFLHAFHEARGHETETVGIFPLYSGKHGGAYLVTMQHGQSRKTFVDACQAIRSKYPGAMVDYHTASGGMATSGVRLEQRLSGSKYSAFVRPGQVRSIDSSGKSRLGDYKAMLEESREALVFDTISGKIFFLGEKLTSSDVPSQSTIVDTFDVLVERLNEDVPNSAFPQSSYTKTKSEMLGKIVIPFLRLYEKRCGGPFPLTCKGESMTFSLRLDQPPVPLVVIRKT